MARAFFFARAIFCARMEKPRRGVTEAFPVPSGEPVTGGITVTVRLGMQPRLENNLRGFFLSGITWGEATRQRTLKLRVLV